MNHEDKNHRHAQGRVKFSCHNVVIEDLLPPLMDGRLTVPDEAHALLHEGAEVDVVGESSVGCDETYAPSFAHADDHLVDNLRDIRFKHQRLFNLVQPRLRLVERSTVKCHVQAAWADLLKSLDDVCVFGKVQRLRAGLSGCEREPFWDAIYGDDPLCTLELRELGNTLANGTQTLEEHVSLQRVASRRLDIPRFPRYRPH